MNRRTFLAGTSATWILSRSSRAAPADPLRVAVIGHTGRGNYGHGLDIVWLRMPQTSIVAVADGNQTGLAEAQKRLQASRGFLDYREMLKTIRPDIVAVCPRQPDQHRDMTVAAIEAGAKGVYVEKPFCRTPKEADDIIAASQKHNAKVAVAHRNRYHPTLAAIDKLIHEGQLGKVLEIRGRGKGDRRGGAEDLWVLGSHVLNLIRYFGGDPVSCSAVLNQDGRRITKADVRDGNEALGPLAGNEVHARYMMSRGITAYFDSLANDRTRSAAFGLQIIGSQGIIDINCDRHPLAHLVPGNPFQPTGKPRPWVPISSAGAGVPEPRDDLTEFVTHHVGAAQDLVDAIRDDRQPLCNVNEGAMTVEMICAAFASHARNSRSVSIPLKQRGNALASL